MVDMNTAITFAALAVGTNMVLGIIMDGWDRFSRWNEERQWRKHVKEIQVASVVEEAPKDNG